MKISKLHSKTVIKASKAVKTNASSSTIRHEFRVISADEINNNRSNAYQYLSF
jgi:hypothetical protein